jgi:hypothetical protein
VTCTDQLQRLLDAGAAEAAGISAVELTAYAEALPDEPGAVLVVHPALAPARRLAPLLRHHDKPGFVVEDMTDLEEFGPIAGLAVPAVAPGSASPPSGGAHDQHDPGPARRGRQAWVRRAGAGARDAAHGKCGLTTR